nr:aminopeptidase O-like [Procambarus clarkii]XP_045598612.1 aminopeptidase O-like [Procambarus clarkii]
MFNTASVLCIKVQYCRNNMSDQDLPLLSNINEIRARHYLIHLKPNFNTKIIQGRVYIFFEPTTPCERRKHCCTRKCFCSDTDVPDTEVHATDVLDTDVHATDVLDTDVHATDVLDTDVHATDLHATDVPNIESAFASISRHTKSPVKDEARNLLEIKREIVPELPYDTNDEYCMTTEINVENRECKDFEVVLDCCDIKVNRITEVSCEGVDLFQYLDPKYPRVCGVAINFWSSREHIPLQYTVDAWSIRICKKGIKNVKQFPQAVCIEYETTPKGKSILWRNDKDGNSCIFTPASEINNRSLLPCQDPPSAMATWQAWVTVSEEYYVSMTGDNVPTKFMGSIEDYMKDATALQHSRQKCCTISQVNQDITFCKEDIIDNNISTVCIYYYTTMVLPIATIAIAIGKWETEILPTIDLKHLHDQVKKEEKDMVPKKYSCCHYEYPCHMKSILWSYETPLRIVYPSSSFKLINTLSAFLPSAVKSAVHLLGTYPCRRVELVILPSCFGSLGLASPNLIFLSPTVVLDDPAAHIRLAHEISHAWFGINIGAQDWTEEWLSEGFATYMEDSIYAEAVLACEKTECTVLEERLCGSPSCDSSQQEAEGSSGLETQVGLSCTSAQVINVSSKDCVLNDTERSINMSCKHSIMFRESGKERNIGEVLQSNANSDHNCYMFDEHSNLAVKGRMTKIKEERFLRNSVWGKKNNNSSSQVLKANTIIFKLDQKLERKRLEELSDLRAHLKYRTLASELENSMQELQTLRPMQGENLVDKDGINYVKNGLNPDKTFLQVHYLKGYFLLKYLSRLVGRAKFDAMLKEYVSVYHGQLVLSKHVLDYFISTFPQVLEKDINQESLYRVWLHQPGLNVEIKEMYGDISNGLVSEVRQHFIFWKNFDKSQNRMEHTIKKAKGLVEEFIFSDQLVLLLEYLLELPKLCQKTLSEVNKHYSISSQSGDVRHRWCELVIKNNYKDLAEVERFLLEDQSMGVYLYGELMIYRRVKHKRLAEEVFYKIQEDMDNNTRQIVFSMLYGD